MQHPDVCLPQGLAGEARRLSTTIAAQEREAAAREGALTAAAEETAKAQSELAESQLHLQQAVADVQVLNTVHMLSHASKTGVHTGTRVSVGYCTALRLLLLSLARTE
jgi:hypothetical protein